MSGKGKITPISPVGDINKRIYEAIIEKQGNDKLYKICKELGLYVGTFRRTLESERAWSQALLLMHLSNKLGKSLDYILTGNKSSVDIAVEKDKEVRRLKRKLEVEREKGRRLLEKIDKLVKPHL